MASVSIFGAGQYAMRCWVNPDKLANLGVTIPEIVNAMRAQNTVNPAGQIGGEPVPPGQQFTYTVRAQGRLVSPEQFGDILIRANPDGSILHLKDVARIELAGERQTGEACAAHEHITVPIERGSRRSTLRGAHWHGRG